MGCGYQPLGLAENHPSVGDSIIERDIVLCGENRFEVGEYVDNVFREDCRLTSRLKGWVESGPAVDGCPSCSEIYGLTVLDTEVEYFNGQIDQEESECNFGLAGGFGLAFAPVEQFPIDDSDGFFSWLNEHEPDEAAGTAVRYALTNWSPSGSSDWTARLGLFDSADPVPSIQDEDCEFESDREHFVKGFWYYNTQHLLKNSGAQYGSVRWKMDLVIED